MDLRITETLDTKDIVHIISTLTCTLYIFSFVFCVVGVSIVSLFVVCVVGVSIVSLFVFSVVGVSIVSLFVFLCSRGIDCISVCF